MSGASVADALEATGTDSVAEAAATQGMSRPISVRELLLRIRPMAYVWRGFRHGWEYNHRLNRLASYVRPARPDEAHDGWFAGHAAASGTGDDIADYEDHYTGVSAPGVGFATGTAVLALDTTKTNPVTVTREVALDVDGPYLDAEQHTALLNGFDVVSAGDANKLLSLDLHVDEPVVRDDGCLTFDLTCEFAGDCGTPECDSGPATDYMLIAHYLVVAGDPGDLSTARVDASLSYDWDVEEELSNQGWEVPAETDDPADGADARRTVGFSRIAIDVAGTGADPLFDVAASNGIPAELDFWPFNRLLESMGIPIHGSAVHMLRWDTVATSVACEDEECVVDFRLFFKNWREDMYTADYPDEDAIVAALTGHLDQIDPTTLRDFKGDLGEIPSSLAALRDAGSASFDVEARLLSFPDPAVFDGGATDDRIYWPGGNRNAASEDAVEEHELPGPTG